MHVDTVNTIGLSILPGPTPTSEYQLVDLAEARYKRSQAKREYVAMHSEAKIWRADNAQALRRSKAKIGSTDKAVTMTSI